MFIFFSFFKAYFFTRAGAGAGQKNPEPDPVENGPAPQHWRREELFKTYFQPQVEGDTSDTGVMRPKVEILSVMAKISIPVVFLVTVPHLFRKFSISSIYKSISYFRPSSSFTGRPFLTGTVPKGKLRLQPGYRTVINWCLDIKFST